VRLAACLCLAAAGFAEQPAEQPLACEVHPVPPALSYRLVYWAGYSVSVPMAQFASGEGALRMQLRITPNGGGEPLLIQQKGELPSPAAGQDWNPSRADAEVRGYFYLGEGEYQADLTMTDSRSRVCRKHWTIELKPHKGVTTPLAPGRLAEVGDLGLRRAPSGEGSLTIFLHAGAARATPVLLASLGAVLERSPFERVEVVVFNLEQRKELLRETISGAESFRRVAQAMEGFNPGTISYQILKDPTGDREFLWGLMAKETRRPQPPVAALFMGFTTLDDPHVFAPPAAKEDARKIRYAYFDYGQLSRGRRLGPMPGGPRRGRPPGAIGVPRRVVAQMDLPDAILRVVKASDGKVWRIHSPADLAAALQKASEWWRDR
jgi:hypothetical protein